LCFGAGNKQEIGVVMRIGIPAFLAASLLLTTPVFAAGDSQDQGALAPGNAAGVQQAQDFNFPIALSIAGVVGVGVAVAILVSNGNSSSTTTTAKP
jgi:hypothetical protein